MRRAKALEPALAVLALAYGCTRSEQSLPVEPVARAAAPAAQAAPAQAAAEPVARPAPSPAIEARAVTLPANLEALCGHDVLEEWGPDEGEEGARVRENAPAVRDAADCAAWNAAAGPCDVHLPCERDSAITRTAVGWELREESSGSGSSMARTVFLWPSTCRMLEAVEEHAYGSQAGTFSLRSSNGAGPTDTELAYVLQRSDLQPGDVGRAEHAFAAQGLGKADTGSVPVAPGLSLVGPLQGRPRAHAGLPAPSPASVWPAPAEQRGDSIVRILRPRLSDALEPVRVGDATFFVECTRGRWPRYHLAAYDTQAGTHRWLLATPIEALKGEPTLVAHEDGVLLGYSAPARGGARHYWLALLDTGAVYALSLEPAAAARVQLIDGALRVNGAGGTRSYSLTHVRAAATQL